MTSSRCLQDTFKASWICTTDDKLLLNRFHDIFKTSWRRFQDAFKTYHSWKIALVNTSSTSFQDILRRHLQKDPYWPHFLKNLWSWFKFSKCEPVQYTETFNIQNCFLEPYMLLLLQINVLLLNSGIRRHIFVSVNKELVNKSMSLTGVILETKFFEKNNTSGTKSSVLHCHQNFRCKFWMKN